MTGHVAPADIRRLLASLADPERSARALPDPERPDPERPDAKSPLAGRTLPAELWSLADEQGVLPIVARKHADQLPARHERSLVMQAGLGMMLRRHAERTRAALAEAGIESAIVKGEAFARHLYDHASDRRYGDLDLLLDGAAVPDAIAALERAGLARPFHRYSDREAAKGEWPVIDPNRPELLVELQTDLVHRAALRERGLRFGLAEWHLARERAVEAGAPADAEGGPFARLATALVHLTVTHKFKHLGLLVDLLQAVRRVRGLEPEAARLLAELRLDYEARVALRLTDAVFGTEECRALLEPMPAGGNALRAGLARGALRIAMPLPTHGSPRTGIPRIAFRALQTRARRHSPPGASGGGA